MICDELVKESMASMRDQAHTVWREIAEQSYHFARHEKVSDFFKLVSVALYIPIICHSEKLSYAQLFIP